MATKKTVSKKQQKLHTVWSVSGGLRHKALCGARNLVTPIGVDQLIKFAKESKSTLEIMFDRQAERYEVPSCARCIVKLQKMDDQTRAKENEVRLNEHVNGLYTVGFALRMADGSLTESHQLHTRFVEGDDVSSIVFHARGGDIEVGLHLRQQEDGIDVRSQNGHLVVTPRAANNVRVTAVR